ncbi:hypothetical protein Kpho02_27910 [Kitasatospora phosalacinea]|uniref:Uncharacterized protein n=1 Tax=Kitasatospora phosalacinea TaxID=2065 RepID=A0A9W6Q5Y1_9ACTN|nr:LamG-like jellyroll fold domain-containing protein [Kitasatospora phosalacinea]GLW70492.1 hypothetical protein Kpho02_27910 [Kitasatospora phosalacinea]
MSAADRRQSPPLTPGRRLGLVLAIAGTVVSLSGPAFADGPPGRPGPGNTTSPTGIAPPPPDGGGPVAVARNRAKKDGKPVTVDELTTGTSLTVANPDGTLTRTDHLQPVRVKKDGGWARVDASLTRNADGSWSPRATPSGVRLSGGGSGPLATFTDAEGRSMSLTLPFALPTPAVTGDGALYPAVLPGVDLKVTVTDQGAFREVLVVHDAAAAANPALKSLRLATATHGLTTRTDQDGNLTAEDADGTAVFTAPTPVMWDSATAPATAPDTHRDPTTDRRPAATDHAVVDPTDRAASSAAGPGRGARLTALKVSSDASGITLTPDQAQLDSPDTVWPLYIDPYVNPATGGTNHFTEVKKGCPSQQLYDNGQDNGEGTGYQQYWSDCYGLYRAFYEFNIGNLDSRTVVSKSTLYFTETHGGDANCSHTLPVTLKLTGAINRDTLWPGPGVVSTIGTQTPKSANAYAGCGNQPVNFDVTGVVSQYRTNGNLTFGLYGNESETVSNYGFMRFALNPYLETVFDVAPNTPDQLGTTPTTSNGCGGGWIGNTGSTGGKSNITLNARLSTDMQGVNLWAQYHVWDNMVNNGGAPADAGWPASSWVANGSTVYTNVGGQVSDGHTYGWNVSAQDGTLGSSGSPYCYFSVDLTPPGVPTVAPSAVFPELGGTAAPTGHAGDAATVKVTANDPTPGGCTLAACISSGIARFEYSMDSNIPGNGALSKPAVQSGGGTATADIPIGVNATQWGTHTLFVRAVDAAGNTQGTVAQYAFFAPWNPTAKVGAGDLDTDGVPDLAAVGINGSLYLLHGNSDPAATPEEASTRATSPDGTSWNNYLVTHRGSATATVDDLFAFQKSTHQLYLYRNDALSGGTPGHFSDPANAYPVNNSSGCPASGSDGTWNNVSQILAVGKLSGYASAPDLVTVDNKELWYYPGTKQAGCFLAAGVKIGTGDWSNTTLLAPGTVNGVPTLWVRDDVTGAVSSFPLAFDAAHQPTTRITAPTRSPLVTGVLDGSGKNLCLDIDNSGTDNGTPAQVYTCNGSDAQNAALGTDGSVHLLGKCLDAAGTGNGTAVQLWDCNNSPAQKWVPGPFAGTLLNPNSGRCLADPAASNSLKTQLILWDCLTDHPEQVWAATTPGKALPAAQPVLPIGTGSRLAPAVASPGDVDGDGYPDLYATSGSGTITRLPGAVTPAAQAADRWKLADTTDSVRSNDLTLHGGASLGTDGSRGVLNGNATDGYADSAAPSLDTGKSFTVSAWVKLNSLAADSTFVSQSGTHTSGFTLSYSASARAFAFGKTRSDDDTGSSTTAYGPSTGATAPAVGTWYHLTGVYDTAANQVTLYVNGTPASTATYGGGTWNATGPLEIGRRLFKSGYGEYLAGSVSDVQTHGAALTPASVGALATGTAQFGTPVPLGSVHTPTDRWRLSDTTDDIRASNNLTAAASTSFVPDTGRNTKVLSLPGTSDALVSTPGKVVDTTRSYSVSAWAYLTNTTSWSTVVAQSAAGTSSFYLQYSKTYNAWAFVAPGDDSTSPATWYAAYAKTPPLPNTWTHLVATYDASSQTMSLYVDGRLAATATDPTPLASTGPLTIGSAKTGDYFPGRISDVQTWNSALPPAAVTALNTNQPVLTRLS